MESFSGDTEESIEYIPGRKKSKLKSLKTLLFGRSKRTGGEKNTKLSQSTSDITAGKELGSDEDLVCSQRMMGSRALSHESIFLAGQVLTDPEPAKVLSQENVHCKIKALQMKLQQQKIHLGPPPMVLPIRRPEEPNSHSEVDSFRCSRPEISGGDVTSHESVSKTISQASSRPLSPIPKPEPAKFVPLTPSFSLPPSIPSTSSSFAAEPPMDFSSPPQFIPCLDTSAARHRMSVKPRNQRACTKNRLAASNSTSHSHTLYNIDHPELAKEEELGAQDKVTVETEQEDTDITSQWLPSKSQQLAPVISEAPPVASGLTFCYQDNAPSGKVPSVSSEVLRVKPHKPTAVLSCERPHSSFLESELKDKRERDFEIQVISHEKRNTLKKAGLTEESSDQLSPTFGSVSPFRSSSVHQQVKSEIVNTKEIRRPSPGAGSFHFSITTAKNQDKERPKSGSFVGALEHAEPRPKTMERTEDKIFSSIKEKVELRESQPRGGPFVMGGLRQEGSPPKSSVLLWDRRDSLKKLESVTTSTDTGSAVGKEAESSQEVVEEAVEAQEVQETDRKTTFGIKLRSTSQSMRLKSDASSNHHLKPPVCDEQCDKQKGQEINDHGIYMSKKLPGNFSYTSSTSGDVRLTDPAPPGLSLPIKTNLPSTDDPHIMSTEVKTTPSIPREPETVRAPQEPQPAPQATSSEVSWMRLAIEKTRSLQQLFTSRLPRDFTGMHTMARPQAQVQPKHQNETQIGAQTQTQTVQMQPNTTPANKHLTDLVKTEAVESRIQAQAIKPSQRAMLPKLSTTSTGVSNTSTEPQMLKQTNEPQLHLITTQSASPPRGFVVHPPVQTTTWTTQSPSCFSTLTETSSQFAQGSATPAQSHLSSGQYDTPQQPPWSNRGLHRTSQLKSTASVSTVLSATAPSPLSASGTGEREATMPEKGGSSLSAGWAVWVGSVSERAALLEKQTEWTNPFGAKGVELKKAQTEVQTPGESLASARMMPLHKDTKLDGRQGVKVAESSPIKVQVGPCEDKWPRKNVSSSPSLSPTQPSVLQCMSDSGQPSWMELAKRKAKAWSDKSMD
nr:uncharacterized protein KIAA1211-like homolog [Monopterus albus]